MPWFPPVSCVSVTLLKPIFANEPWFLSARICHGPGERAAHMREDSAQWRLTTGSGRTGSGRPIDNDAGGKRTAAPVGPGEDRAVRHSRPPRSRRDGPGAPGTLGGRPARGGEVARGGSGGGGRR